MDKRYWILPTLLAITIISGCSTNPDIRKQKYLASGNRYFQKQDYRAAAIQYQNAIQIDPKYGDAHHQLGLSFLRLSDWNGAYRELSRTVDLTPANLKAQLELGTLLLAARHFDEAQQRADLVLQKDPNNVEAHILRANALAQLQEVDASLKEMQEAIELNPERGQSYLNMALLLISAKQMAAAEESFKKAVSVDPKSFSARLALGQFYAALRRWPEAEMQFQRAMEIEPQNIAPRIALCTLMLAENQPSQAEEIARDTKNTLKDLPEAYRLLGDFYFRTGNISKAVEEYTSLYKQHPKDLVVKRNYVQLLIIRGQLDEADKLNAEILKAHPLDQPSLIARDEILIKQGHAAETIDPLRAAVKNDPDNALAHYYLGVALNSTGASEQAESEWRSAVRLNPNLVDAQSALAAVALRKGDRDDVANAAEAMILARPNSPDGYVLRALAKASKNDQVGAETDLNKAMAVDPHNPAGFIGMAQFRAAQRKYADSEKAYEQALSMEPNATAALQGLVAVLLAEKHPDTALNKVSEMIAKVPQNSEYYMLESSLFLNSKPPEFDKAEADLLKASELSKTDATPLLILAQIYTERGSADKAGASAQAAIQHNPKDARAYFLSAAIEERQGNWQKAQELYERTLQVQTQFPLASNNLAYLMLEHDENSDVALSLAQTARQELPDNTSVADTLGWAYYKKGTYNLAVDLLKEAVKKTPDNPSIQYHLGLAYQKLGDKPKAKAYLERTLQLSPSFAHAADVRTAIAALGA